MASTQGQCIPVCLRTGCRKQVVTDDVEMMALHCNDRRCELYMSQIIPDVLDVTLIAAQYYKDLSNYEVMGGAKSRPAKELLIAKRNALRCTLAAAHGDSLAVMLEVLRKRARPPEDTDNETTLKKARNNDDDDELAEEVTDVDAAYLESLEGMRE
jgi:hypothetical protein